MAKNLTAPRGWVDGRMGGWVANGGPVGG